MLNKIVLMGRMTKNPDLRYTSSGTAVTSFTLAVDRDYDRTQVDFVDCVAWRKTADFVAQYFVKGSMAVVAGSLQFRDWTDKNGNSRRNAEIIVDNIYFGEGKKKEAPAETTENTGSAFEDLNDEDGPLPF